MCCIQWIFKYIFSNNATHKLTIKDLILIPVKPIAPYWYLYVLIFYYLFFICVDSVAIHEKLKLIIGFLISAVGSCVKIDGIFPLYRIIIYSVFFYLGIFLAKDKDAFNGIKQHQNMLKGGICSGVVFVASIFSDSIILNVNFVGIFAAAIISVFVISLFAKTEYTNRFLNVCGKHSLDIYLIHCFITAANRVLLTKLGITIFIVNVLVNFVMAIFIPIACSYVLKKTKIYTICLHPFSLLAKKW